MAKKTTRQRLLREIRRKRRRRVASNLLEFNRDFKTINNDPVHFSDVEGIEVNLYPAGIGEKYQVFIDVKEDPSLSAPGRNFPNEEEANHFARQYVDYVRRVLGR